MMITLRFLSSKIVSMKIAKYYKKLKIVKSINFQKEIQLKING
jgi:hypothetical protein